MKTATRSIADDGETFDTREACEAHEAETVTKKLVGLTLPQLIDAIDRKDIELATALEEIGVRCNRARIAAGEVRRRPKAEASATPAGEPAVPASSGRKRAAAGAAA